MLDLDDARERARRGATLIDQHANIVGADWRKRINEHDLIMMSTCSCILGQLFEGQYGEGIGVLLGIWEDEYEDEQFEPIIQHGFAADDPQDYPVLQQAWMTVLAEGK
jgi:hypothetical protein